MSLELEVHRIRDPAGHGAALRLKGDWILLAVRDGDHCGVGEASHSGDDGLCATRARELFETFIRGRELDLEIVGEFSLEAFAEPNGLVMATAMSALDQALHDLVARRARLPVWRLFADAPAQESVPLYATINRALSARDAADVLATARAANERGFDCVKCAPFDEVGRDADEIASSAYGFERVELLRRELPALRLRVDCHERFSAEAALELAPRFNALGLDWLEEPCPLGSVYRTLRETLECPLAAAELLWGCDGFRVVVEGGLADVVMPDVKHVGGFGPLVEVCRLAEHVGVEVSPHNPSGPVSTLASLHAAAVSRAVTSVEVPFLAEPGRCIAERFITGGAAALPEAPGWGMTLGEILETART